MFEIKLPIEILICIQMINNSGYEAFVIGGAVRDTLLNREVHDYDISSNATPNIIHSIFKDYPVIDTGLQHGTVTVVINHVHIEITTYRLETSYTDHRHPDKVTFSNSLKEDCARRDFTINALGYHPTLGLQDYFHGLDDLNNKCITCVGNPTKRFKEDALRIMRAIRFACQLDFTISKETSSAIHACKEDLQYIAIERITEEFNKILLSNKPSSILYEYIDVLEVFLPSFKTLSKETFNLLDSSEIDLTIRYAILFQNLDKKNIRTLKLPNKLVSDIYLLINSVSLPCDSLFDIRYILYKVKDLETLYFSYRNIVDKSFNKVYVHKILNEIHTRNDCVSLKDLTIKGNDLQALGFTGSSIKETLDKCLLDVMNDKIHNNKKELLQYIETLK